MGKNNFLKSKINNFKIIQESHGTFLCYTSFPYPEKPAIGGILKMHNSVSPEESSKGAKQQVSSSISHLFISASKYAGLFHMVLSDP